jgi:uncharacterized protein (UPF0332 family)
VSPGQRQRAESELAAAAEALRAAMALLGLGLTRDAISRLYYAVFHAARAALVSRGLHAKTHSGQRSRFVATFGPAPTIGRLLKLRIDADYRSQPPGETGAELASLVEEATTFVERCRGLVSEAIAAGIDDPDPPPDV